MKNKKIIGLTLLSALLISGCTNANDKTTPIKDSTNTTIRDSTNTPIRDSTNTPVKDSTNTSTNTESVESENYQYYPLADGTLSIAVGNNRDLQYLTIPKMHHGKMVTQIADNGFANCTALKQINLPDNINIIGEQAFSGCSSLNSINIPDGTSVIGNYAFYGCSSLSSVTIPDGVTSIGVHVFEGCYSLTSVVIPDSVTSIGEYAFEGCESLTSVVIPNSVTSIGDSAFIGCDSLTICCAAERKPRGWDDNWNKIDQSNRARTEWGCEGGGTYLGLAYRIDIIKGERVAKIVNYRGFKSELTIPSVIEGTKVVGIGDSAFKGCYSLSSVTIPDGVTSIGEYAFEGCSSLTICCAAKRKPRGWDDNWNKIARNEYDHDRVRTEWGCEGGGTYLGLAYRIDIIKGERVAKIVNYRGFKSELTIPSVIEGTKVVGIGDSAFKGCSSLTIYCVAEREPKGWDVLWNPSDCHVVWGYKSKP